MAPTVMAVGDRTDFPVLLRSGYTAGPIPGGHAITADIPIIWKPFTRHAFLHQIHTLLADRRK